jgi:TRAP-type C4-dicarboxylate transport system permease small subunit
VEDNALSLKSGETRVANGQEMPAISAANQEKESKGSTDIFSTSAMKLSRFIFWIACAALLVVVFLTTCDVILRKLGSPLAFSNEIVVIMAGIIVGFALPQSILDNVHVQMDFLTVFLGGKHQFFLIIITRLLAAGLLLILGWSLMARGQYLKKVGQMSPILEIPDYPVAYGIGICSFLGCIALFVAFVKMSKDKKSGKSQSR